MPDDSHAQPLGAQRCPTGISWDEIIDQDSRPVPEFLKDTSYKYLGSTPLPAGRYTDPEFFRLEKEKMWPKIWQFAARNEDMPEPNDYVVYENLGRSYLIIRQQDGTAKAFYNACRHRGRQLRSESGSAADLRCGFHGWTFNMDGSIKSIPCRWDFPQVTDDAAHLAEVSCQSWGGYIFVRDAKDGPSIEEFLAPLPEFFKRWPHEDCYTVVNVAKVIHANWKATAEPFMESYHAPETHPQLTGFIGDVNALYGMWGDHVNLDATPFGVPSPVLENFHQSEQWIVNEYLRFSGRNNSTELSPAGTEIPQMPVPDGSTARRALAAETRASYAQLGCDVEHVSDAEMIDALTFNVFPNFAPWGGYSPAIVYRWRPWPDHRSTLMEIRILMRAPKGAKHPPSVPQHMLREDEPWSAAPELGVLGSVVDQDMENIPFVQLGLEANPDGQIQLADYQEIRIRHFHATLDKYLNA